MNRLSPLMKRCGLKALASLAMCSMPAFAEIESASRIDLKHELALTEITKDLVRGIKGDSLVREFVEDIKAVSSEMEIRMLLLDVIRFDASIAPESSRENEMAHAACQFIVGSLIESASREIFAFDLLGETKSENASRRNTSSWYLAHLWGQNPSFEFLKPIIENNPVSVPSEVVKFMFSTDPLLTLKTFAEIHGATKESIELIQQKYIIIMKDVVKHRRRKHDFLPVATNEEANEQVRSLSHDDRWWIRRWTVEVMKDSPPHCRPELLQELRQDPHPLVREAALKVECATGN